MIALIVLGLLFAGFCRIRPWLDTGVKLVRTRDGRTLIRPAVPIRKSVHERLCPVCGYDLRASSGECPECGEPIPERTPVKHP